MNEVVLKGELHTSQGDLNEERELLKEGFDVLVLEGASSDPEYRPFDGWFQISIALVFSTLGKIQLSKTELIDLAKAIGTEVRFTRESDTDILHNAPVLVQLIGGTLFYILLGLSLLYGAITGNYFVGALYLLAAAGTPIVLLRGYNMYAQRGSKNRDQIMAQHIIDATEHYDRILAIVGRAHLGGISKRLPDDIKVDVKEPVYGIISLRLVREIVWPLFLAYATLLGIYVMVLFVYENLLF